MKVGGEYSQTTSVSTSLLWKFQWQPQAAHRSAPFRCPFYFYVNSRLNPLFLGVGVGPGDGIFFCTLFTKHHLVSLFNFYDHAGESKPANRKNLLHHTMSMNMMLSPGSYIPTNGSWPHLPSHYYEKRTRCHLSQSLLVIYLSEANWF